MLYLATTCGHYWGEEWIHPNECDDYDDYDLIYVGL